MTAQVSLITGLGNPGARHERTLHNAGFWFVDELARQLHESFRYEKRFDAEICRVRIADEDVWLIKPQSYMNLSGGPIRSMLDYYRLSIEHTLIAHDEIDLPPGTVRLKKGGGHGGHNGLRDIIRHCGAAFMRLRLGVGHPGDRNKVTSYVLKPGDAQTESAIMQNIDEAIAVLPMLVQSGLSDAMTRLHSRRES